MNGDLGCQSRRGIHPREEEKKIAWQFCRLAGPWWFENLGVVKRALAHRLPCGVRNELGPLFMSRNEGKKEDNTYKT